MTQLRKAPLISSCLSLENSNTSSCSSYSYEFYMGYKSFTTELDWICDNAWKLTLGQSMFFVGSVVGSLVFGFLADIVGE